MNLECQSQMSDSAEYIAISSLRDSWIRTRNLLWPIKWGVWLRIACIAFFIGGCVIHPFGSGSSDGFDIPFSPTLLTSGPLSDYSGLVTAILTALFLIITGYALVSSIFQFVFVDCLSSGDVTLSKPFLMRSGKGFLLFLFYMIILVLMAVLVFGCTIFFFLPVLNGGQTDPVQILSALLFLLLLLFVLLLPFWIILILTNDFVVPIMIKDGCGVITGWKRCIRLFHGRLMEGIVYVGVKIFLTVITGIILGLVVLFIGMIIGISFDQSLFVNIFSLSSPRMVILFGIYLMIIGFSSLFLMVPVITFFRYYSLRVLECLNYRYHLFPDSESNEDIHTTKPS